MLNEILHDDVKLVGVGECKARLHEHILHFRKRQLKGDGKCNDRGLGRLVGLVRTDLREELPVNICLLVALRVRHAVFINLPQKHLRKALVDLSQCIIKSCRLFGSDCHRSCELFNALTQFLALAQKESVQNREVGDLRKSAIKECAEKIRILQKQNEQHKASKLRLYEKYAAGSITKEAYIQQKVAADVKIAENDEAIQRSHERMKELDSETSCSDEKLDAVCDQYADCKALTYELTHAFISAVYIYDLDNIEIVWKFKDFLTTSEGEAK